MTAEPLLAGIICSWGDFCIRRRDSSLYAHYKLGFIVKFKVSRSAGELMRVTHLQGFALIIRSNY